MPYDNNEAYRQQVLMAITRQPLQSNLKSTHTWLDNKNNYEQLPKLEAAASVPTKLDHYNCHEEPTPKVMPYEMDESSMKEQLRMPSGERSN